MIQQDLFFFTGRFRLPVDAVPAYNYSEGRTQYRPKGRDNGFILTLDGFRVYVSRDTGDVPEMSGIKNIDVAFFSTNRPFTMTPEPCAKAVRTVRPKVLLPYHYSFHRWLASLVLSFEKPAVHRH